MKTTNKLNIKPLVFFSLLNSLCSFYLKAQPPTVEWEMLYGSTFHDHPDAIAETTDGGYLLSLGTRRADGDIPYIYGETDIWLAKLGKEGAIEWSRTMGGSDLDGLSHIVSMKDGGFLLICHTKSDDFDVPRRIGGWDVWLVKLDAEGNLAWSKVYGGTGDDGVQAFEALDEGGIRMIVTTSISDVDFGSGVDACRIWRVELDSDGDIVSKESICMPPLFKGDSYTNVIFTSDGGLLGVAAYAEPGNGSDVCIVKYDSLLSVEWSKCFGGSAIELTYDAIEIPGRGFAIASTSYSKDGDVYLNRGSKDIWLLQIDYFGMLINAKTYGGKEMDDVRNIVLSDGGQSAILFGHTFSKDGDIGHNQAIASNLWLVKVNISSGDIEWERCYGGTAGEFSRKIYETRDGGYILLGESMSPPGGDIKSENKNLFL